MEFNTDLSLYHIFYQAAETGSFSKAADRLFISQPAVSKRIQKLEQSLDTQLFLRGAKGVTLTDAGRLLYDQISIAFRAISQGEEQVMQYQKLGLGRIQIGASSTMCKHILLPYLRRYIRENPNIEVNVLCPSSTSTLNALHAGQLDLGLIALPDIPVSEQFHYLQDVHYIFAASPAYLENMQARGFTAPRELLENGNIMLLNKENASRRHVDAYFNEQHITVGTPMEINNMVLIADFARIGLGIGCVIEEFVSEELAGGTLVKIPLSVPIAPRKVGFVFLKDHYEIPAVVQFRKLLADTPE